MLFSQVSELQMPQWLISGGGLASIGITAWYLWYTVTKILPEKDRQHAALIEKIVAEFRSDSVERTNLDREVSARAHALALTGQEALHEVKASVDSLRFAIMGLGVFVETNTAATAHNTAAKVEIADHIQQVQQAVTSAADSKITKGRKNASS